MKSFSLIRKLVGSSMWQNPGRAIITVIGIMASTCAVVWIVSGYDALVSQFDENAEKYLGRYDAILLPSAPPGSLQTIDANLVAELRQDPGILELNPITQSRVSVTRVQKERETTEESALGLLVGSRPPVNGAPPIDPILVGTPAAEPPYEMVEGSWFTSATSAQSAVISEGAARQVGVTIGDDILITSLANQVRLKIIGIAEQPPAAPSLRGGRPPGRGARSDSTREGNGKPDRQRSAAPDAEEADGDTKQATDSPRLGLPNAYVQGPAVSAVYVRPELSEKINGFASTANVLQLSFRDGVELEEFQSVWRDRFSAASPPVRAVGFEAIRGGMTSTRDISSQRSQAWAATGMAAMAAVFIIFSTLSMGVSERTREFAMLRAIALTRTQLAGIIAFESVTLAILGWISGLAAGWVMLTAGSQFMPEFFDANVVLGRTTLLLTGLTVIAGALGAAVLPAWRAMRIRSLEATAAIATQPRRFRWMSLAIPGLLLAAAAPVTVFLAPLPDAWRSWLYGTVTWPALLIGIILLTPLIVVLCERTLAPPLTMLLGLDVRLVRTQLSSNLWRTIGATLALSLGLALYASTQTWGYSMLQPFLPGAWLPDMLVAFHPIGLDDEGIEAVHNVPGIETDGVLPLAIEQARFDWGKAGQPPRVQRDNAVLFGLDPERSLAGESPFLNLHFVAGDRETAIAAMQSGDGCLISEDFQMSTEYEIGDELSFTPPNAPEETVTYRIAGVVSLPGWHWITKFSGVRRHFVRTATVVFASQAAVSRDFHLHRTEFFWLNLESDTPLEKIEANLQAIAERDAGKSFQTEDAGTVKAYRPFARTTATETVRRAITLRAHDMIWGMSQLPLVTLIIMSLAVANAMLASVRSRRWEFGVLRSIGITRSQLVRLILAETILIGLVACILSLSFGLIAGWCGVGMAQYGGWFAGPPTFLIPWSQLSIGFSLTLLLCFLAGIWPAIQAGRTEPLKLLQAGKSAM
ncbi:FtsX family ABC transporter permease [Rubinisphaera sp. JC750]|uniref:FtsX family ABC transporter permease n=1 Tax=Rubinisphaera sp. JC750 TaxID=2898658 RepID=UPI001F03031D|nr:FtsX family ABC transporter permease [Rubinisphaera sp. JC750]